MNNWLYTYGKFLNFHVLELELGLPTGVLLEAQKNSAALSPDVISRIHGFLAEMEGELRQAKIKK